MGKPAYVTCIDDDGYQVVEYPPPTEEVVCQAIEEAVEGYRRVFGERLLQVWIFGSRATKTHRPDSDVDLLAVLDREGPIFSDLAC